ncbi:general stress protein [Paenibacillus pasadenensis]|uniref:general stress protein n=1 Tax=Paenibacillus pasadenensis TaxID=217090 RepID=UPI00204059A9|nr:general stress protein [Paenibacillus pasadenensis]MCM3748323.1 general stress protein [Paenibacillus pasadenensis]
MSKTIAIFNNQESVIQAVKSLRDSGFAADEIKVVGRDRESVRFVESDTDVHAEELQEIRDARGADGAFIPGDGFIVGAAPLGGSSVSGTGAAPYWGGAYPAAVGTGIFSDDTPFEDIFKDFGLSEKNAERCRDAISEGGIVVVAEREDGSKDNYVADGPTDDSLASAETILRSNGASEIL